ncbi:MAG: hypothetical protein A2Y57_01150 [Candidatus Woykebacteria bacterium RBG_13_40_7b]|uniref:HIT domain-containing protein n=1 Tax=Candidatus Woykebacteria bacterium RBG_13_40_7b TaxID=1802594 RepID=A0A1G1WB36_9BACT|nr:MAG: hypothetical protein A2Y57_01150 [Candidatus Woykebacteria bacterium RBG_13_40_7b]
MVLIFFSFKHPLEETAHFWVNCEVNPLCEGHILIIPKKHFSCVADYPQAVYKEFVKLYSKFSNFLAKEYNSISTFEHGKVSQTVFHSHTHLIPYQGDLTTIIPEGKNRITKLNSLTDLKRIFEGAGGYLFFSIGDNLWTVDLSLAEPAFFRHRFAAALGKPERGDWRKMRGNRKIMSEVEQEISGLKKRWSRYHL